VPARGFREQSDNCSNKYGRTIISNRLSEAGFFGGITVVITDAEGKPMRFATEAAERAWMAARSASATPPPATCPDARAERIAIRIMIRAVEAEFGPILDDDGKTPYLQSVRRRGLSRQQVASELGKFIALTTIAAATREATP
jgi:hypothetical protein